MTTVHSREDSWVSIAQAAEQLGIHPRTLRRYIRQGRIDVQRLSPQVVRIKPEEILRFRDGNICVATGTGTCYIERQEDDPAPAEEPKANKPRAKGQLKLG